MQGKTPMFLEIESGLCLDMVKCKKRKRKKIGLDYVLESEFNV